MGRELDACTVLLVYRLTDVISFVCDERELNFIQINFDISFTSLVRNEKEEVLYFFSLGTWLLCSLFVQQNVNFNSAGSVRIT